MGPGNVAMCAHAPPLRSVTKKDNNPYLSKFLFDHEERWQARFVPRITVNVTITLAKSLG